MGKRGGEKERFDRLKKAIIILSVLLVVSVIGLAAQYVITRYFSPSQATVVVPDNLIGETGADLATNGEVEDQPSGSPASTDSQEMDMVHGGGDQAVVLELNRSVPGVNEKFEAHNLFPGDYLTKYYCLKVCHREDTELLFRIAVTEQQRALGDVLRVTVTCLNSGKVLCDAPFNQVDGIEFSERLAAVPAGVTELYYRIDVSLDTGVGNAYQVAGLLADFEWYTADSSSLTPPTTGDTARIVLWAVLACSALGLVILLPLARRREGGQQ